jgi:KUP system potassium uptake protein
VKTGLDEPKRPLAPLALSALGVVFGDLGTSPLYALQEAFGGKHGVDGTPENVLGVVSLFIWSLLLVVSLKYVFFIMRADNRGEGGILALLALTGARGKESGRAQALLLVGLFGATLLYGDGVITPAVSVLSAVEGLNEGTTAFAPYVVPLTVVILIALFSVQRFGSGAVGRFFGPVLLLWFIAIFAIGLGSLVKTPGALEALSPLPGVRFFLAHGFHGLPVLGAVVLCLTGGEALYADMGHFGSRPIRLSWYVVVLPALVMSYLGQAAVLLREPDAVARPFYRSAPAELLYPLVGLATVATVIASQALISAVFSLTRQAAQMGYWPRVQVVHTSARTEGQIYVPGFNWALMVACVALVLAFRTSTSLAGAFGLAVAGTMSITTVLFGQVAWRRFGWPIAGVALFLVVFLSVDVAFVGANLLKVVDGGWLPLTLGAALFVMMTVWGRGRRHLQDYVRARAMSPREFLDSFSAGTSALRVKGTAVFLSINPDATPVSLLHYLKHAKCLHEKVVFLTVVTEDVPRVGRDERVEVELLRPGFWRVIGHFGFMEDPDVPWLLERAIDSGLDTGVRSATFFLGRDTIIPSERGRWRGWGERLFAVMHRNARPAPDFFRLPPNRVMEIGAQLEL